MQRLGLLFALGIAAVTAVACSAPAEEEGESGEAAVITEGAFYGNDRVGAVLKGHPEKVPATFDAFETTFGVGRACQRKDSKEIFVVEESETRLEGGSTATKLMPRAVITGCNTGDLSDPASVTRSYGLFAALISDPQMHESEKGDTMRMWPLEVMALDETTGLYNFYVFEPAVTPDDPWAVLPPSTPGQVTRIHREVDKVLEQHLEKGKPVTDAAPPAQGSKRCFACHVNGAPLMNEMRDPWTNWVSFKKALPASTLWETTKSLVSEAVPDSKSGRSSLANDLEPIMRTAIQSYVFGTTKTNGWAHATVRGEQPGGVKKMLESVFCETELNYVTASQSLPLEIWVDPDTIIGTDITPPPSFGDDTLPFEFPIRSAFDQQTESWLTENRYLSAPVVTAIRLLDDENDIFASARCNVLPEIVKDLPTDPAKVLAKIRTVLTAKLATLSFKTTQPKRAAYIKALLGAKPPEDDAPVQTEYLTERVARFTAADKTDKAVSTKEAFRKKSAVAKFSGRSNPLPVLEAHK
jgi:hypothetical protein